MRDAVKTVIGWALVVGSTALFVLGLYHLIRGGTCASGGPYVSARQCPSGTGWWMGAVAVSVFTALFGGAILMLREGGKVRRKDAPGTSAFPLGPARVFAPGARLTAPAATADPLDRLARLASLHDEGALTDSEFAAQKAQVLAEM